MRPAAIYRSPSEKFERQMEDDARRADAHRVRSRFQAGQYRAACSCTWTGPWRATPAEADADGQAHRP